MMKCATLAMMLLFTFAVTCTAFERIANVVSTGTDMAKVQLLGSTGVVQFGGWDVGLQQRAHALGVRTFSEFGWACLPSQPCTWIANRTEAALRAQATVDLLSSAALMVSMLTSRRRCAELHSF